MNRHTGATPFSCDGCDAQFRNQGTLCKHKQKHHGYKTKTQVAADHHSKSAANSNRNVIAGDRTERSNIDQQVIPFPM